MSKRFVPVSDPERARCEQDEESLRKHRKFDTPFAMLPSNLNEKRPRGQGDMNPLGSKATDMEQDAQGLWRKKAALFDKQKSWGRETAEYSNPEQARCDGNDGPQYGRPGVAGWVKQGKFGGRGEDKGLGVLQRGEVDQTMEKNEKGLWVRKKSAEPSNEPAASKGHWRCSHCGLETTVSMEFCRKFECNGQRPRGVLSDPDALRKASKNEDPRLEAAKQRSRGTRDAAEQALRALEERRRDQQREKEKLGMMRRPDMRAMPQGKVATMNSSSQQVKPAPRVKQCHKWQGVQRSDEEAQKVVARAIGGSSAEASSAAVRIENSDKSILKSRRPAADADGGGAFVDLPEDDASADGSRSRSRSPAGTQEEVVVDFF